MEQIPTLKKYRSQQNQYAMKSSQRLHALVQIGTALAGNGIRMLSMKGPLLSMELYGDPSLRTSRDLDVMVAEEDIQWASEVLTGLGYKQETGPFLKTPLQSLLLVIGPSSYELELIDLPDWLFWLYFLIPPFHWLWRKLSRKLDK